MKLFMQRGDFTLDVEVSVSAHERIGIIGPNGSGKSSLLSCWAQASRANGLETVLLEQRTECFPHLSVLENIAFPLRARGMDKNQAHTQAQQVVERAQLHEVATAMPTTLSGGQRQRVALLRALATGATTALLDEPLVGLDVEASREYRELLTGNKQINQLVIALHDPSEILHLVDRILLLENGSLVADMSTADLFQMPPNPFAAALVDCNRVVDTDVVWFHPSDVTFHAPASGFQQVGVVQFIDVLPHTSRITFDLVDLNHQRVIAEVAGKTELSPGETCTLGVDEKHLRRGQSVL